MPELGWALPRWGSELPERLAGVRRRSVRANFFCTTAAEFAPALPAWERPDFAKQCSFAFRVDASLTGKQHLQRCDRAHA
jgi:hypothetical protein